MWTAVFQGCIRGAAAHKEKIGSDRSEDLVHGESERLDRKELVVYGASIKGFQNNWVFPAHS